MNTQTELGLVFRTIMVGIERRVKDLFEYAESHPEASLSELEAQALRLGRDCFAEVLQAVVEGRREGEEGERCCRCGAELRYKGEQVRRQETLVGRICWRRGYYYCESCGEGHYPLDEALGVGPGQFSDGIQEKISRLAAALPFREAVTEFSELTGISVSAREAQRISEGRGRALEERGVVERRRLFSGEETGMRRVVREDAGTWAVALDAAKVRFDDGWHEVKAGAVFRVQPQEDDKEEALEECQSSEREAWKVKATEQSYVAQVGSMEKAGERLYAEAIRRGIDPAEDLVVCLADGAPGNWSQFDLHFPKRVEVLDWYHAMEHLWAAGKGLFGEGTEEAKQWVETRKEELWKGEVETVMAALQQVAKLPQGKAAEKEIHYFETNKGRMRYPQYRSKGYPIGSGTVESACKHLIGARLKQSGMCWSKDGAQAILNLRAAKLSNCWDEAWQTTRPLRLAA